ncbi:MAG TPA: restriction endonuclease subunit S, partial [Chryseolinea sp.]|nr:restriction endonuclease subunit S [Chryseolinea sp.]
IPANLLKFTVSKNADLKYVFWYLNFSLFQKKLKEISTATAQPAFNVTKFRQLTIPLPPLDEQHRIVAKIEELFSSLDKGIESLKAAQQQLKIYRQSVLKWAFEGRLTNNTQVGELPEGWKCEPLGEIAELCLGKMLDKEKNRGEYQPYLRNINVRWGTFDLSSLEMMRFEDSEKERYSVQLGDLVICEGGEPGRCAIWTSNHTMYIQKALHRVRLVKNYHPKYIYYYMFFLASNGQLEQYFTGTTIKHLTGRELKRIKILAPPKYNEQEKIISQIESRLSICDRLEESISQNMQQSDALRQSILKKAFEGAMVT